MNKNSKLTQCTGIVLILLFSKVLKLFGLQRFGVVFFVVFLFFYCKNTISSAKIIWQYPASWAALAAAAPSTTLPRQTLLQDPRLFPSPSCHSLAKNRPPLALPLLPFGGRGTLQSTQGTSQPSQKMDWAANTFQVWITIWTLKPLACITTALQFSFFGGYPSRRLR